MAIYKEQDFSERRNAANAAKQALLERFKAKPAADDPAVLAKQAERQAVLEAREKRAVEKEKLKQEKLVREAIERAEREAAAEAARIAAEEAATADARAKEAQETERISRLLADEAAQKAKRDARYAARKSKKR